MGRIGRPQEFAALAATLVSPRLGFVTGVVAPVDGGAGIGSGDTFDSAQNRH